jgi:SAM-dependent methyltransferase
VYDLGSGDGRIIIVAAQRYGARGVGVEIDPKLVAAARRRAREAGVDSRVAFLQDDAKAVDLSAATVVTLYLRMNLKLRPALQQQLQRGARIVALNFDMGDWLPDEAQLIEEPDGESSIFYLWRIGDTDGPTPTRAGEKGGRGSSKQDPAAQNA